MDEEHETCWFGYERYWYYVLCVMNKKEAFYSRVPEYQAPHLCFFVFIMEFSTLFSTQGPSENLLLPHTVSLQSCEVTTTMNTNISLQIKESLGSKVIPW